MKHLTSPSLICSSLGYHLRVEGLFSHPGVDIRHAQCYSALLLFMIVDLREGPSPQLLRSWYSIRICPFFKSFPALCQSSLNSLDSGSARPLGLGIL